MKSFRVLRSSRVRAAVVTIGASGLLAVAAAAFWFEDIRYSLPTPRPEGLNEPPVGTELPVGAWLAEAGLTAAGRPALVHFVNPDCPCSRFNVDHLRKLHARFGEQVFFVAAVQSRRNDPAANVKVRSLELGIPTFADPGGLRAAEAGVYSTPQALIVDGAGRIVYRGNYNVSRYCTDPRTEFVRIALEKLTVHDAVTLLPEVPAYGCELPSSTEPAPEQLNRPGG